jgi:hypothetical protein
MKGAFRQPCKGGALQLVVPQGVGQVWGLGKLDAQGRHTASLAALDSASWDSASCQYAPQWTSRLAAQLSLPLREITPHVRRRLKMGE